MARTGHNETRRLWPSCADGVRVVKGKPEKHFCFPLVDPISHLWGDFNRSASKGCILLRGQCALDHGPAGPSTWQFSCFAKVEIGTGVCHYLNSEGWRTTDILYARTDGIGPRAERQRTDTVNDEFCALQPLSQLKRLARHLVRLTHEACLPTDDDQGTNGSDRGNPVGLTEPLSPHACVGVLAECRSVGAFVLGAIRYSTSRSRSAIRRT